MRFTIVAGLACLIFAQDSFEPTVAQLEAMERYAARPSARTSWSAEVDRIVGGASTAVVTAVVVADNSQTPRQMRGARIDFQMEGKRARVFVQEEFADRMIGALDEVATASEGFLNGRDAGSSKCFGSGVFLQQMRAGAHFMSASQCEMADGWRGLSIWTADGTFRFTDLDPTPFARAVRRAMNELKKR